MVKYQVGPRQYQAEFQHFHTIHHGENEGLRGKLVWETVCSLAVKNPDGTFRLAVGHAICSPKDQFSKSKGAKLALGRAVVGVHLHDWEARKAFWEAYPSIPPMM